MAPTSICGCRVCKWKCEPVDVRIIRKHLEKYGKCFQGLELRESSTSDSDLPTTDLDEEKTDPEHGFQEASPSCHFTFDDSSDLEVECQAVAEPLHIADEDDPHSTDGSSDTSEDGMQELNSETSEDEDIHVQTNFWSLDYSRNLYSDEIATTILPHCSITLLQWLALNFDLFSSHPSTSKSAFSDYLLLQSKMQNATSLPKSYEEARRLIRPFLLKKKVFDICSNECVAYWNSQSKQYSHLSFCPICSEPRYFSMKKKRPTAKRSFTYLPVGPRLARLYGDANLAQIIQSHGGNLDKEEDVMWDLHDSPAWKEQYSEMGFFSGNNMGVSLALELDGVNPFHNIGVPYSMTPIMLTVLNWPRHMRNAFGNIMLVGIIPGNNRSETNNLDPYINILVEELLYLSGCTAYSAYHNAPVDIKVKLLFFVLDYPGLSKLFGQHGSGSLMGCHWCLIRGIHCKHNSKVIYLSNRSFLKMDDKLRENQEDFMDKSVDFSLKPKLRDYVAEQSYRRAFDNAKNKTQASIIATATGCKGIRAINSLTGLNRVTETQPDACHTIKDVVQNIMNLITSRKINIENIVKAEVSFGRLNSEVFSIENTQDAEASVSGISQQTQPSAPKKKKKSYKANATSTPTNLPYLLTKDELNIADKRATQIRPPLGFGTKPSPFITKPGALKSHDWKQLASQGILKYCLRGLMGVKQRKTLFLLFDSIAEMCAESQCSEDIDQLEVKLNQALAYLERDFPLSLQNITTHLLHHIVDGIRRFGPVYGTWMYVFERFNSWICKRALNMRHPESTAIETFIIFDWCQYMKLSDRMPCLKNVAGGKSSSFTAEFLDCVELADADYNMLPSENKQVTTTLTKKQTRSIFKKIGHSCSRCTYKLYFSHVEKNTKTNRHVFYGCSTKEKCNAQTVSSNIFGLKNRGKTSAKVESGKYVQFGSIHCFYNCTCENTTMTNNLAKITWYDDLNFDNDTGLWLCNYRNFTHTSYELIPELSKPLLTALDGDVIWFLNSGLLPFKTSDVGSVSSEA